MSKKAHEIKPNYAPVYVAGVYPDLAKIFQSHGYALTVHGSVARDLDLVAIPWDKNFSDPKIVLANVTNEFAFEVAGKPEEKNHGRIAYTLVGACEFFIDLSFINT